jgi:trehalose 6-phosphate synthase
MRQAAWKNAVKYGAPAMLVLVLLTVAVAPFSRSLVEQWARRDVESRSRLAYTSIQGPVIRALTDGDSARLGTILEGVAGDERVLAVGLCNDRGALREATRMMPQTFSCDKVARSEAESFSSIVNDGRRVLVGSFPITTRDERSHLLVLHDLSYVDARSGQAQTYAVAALVGVAIIIAALATLLVIFFMRGWMDTLRRRCGSGGGRPESATSRASTFRFSACSRSWMSAKPRRRRPKRNGRRSRCTTC